MDDSAPFPSPADFGGICLAGECSFPAELLLPDSTYFGLTKEASYIYGTWRDPDRNLVRALRGIGGTTSALRFLFVSGPNRQLMRDPEADKHLWQGGIDTIRTGDVVTFTAPAQGSATPFSFRHEPTTVHWVEADYLDASATCFGPAVQWFNTWDGGACFSATAKYRSTGTLRGRPVEGFVGHEIHYFPHGANWINSPFGRGREICWQQIANEYEDGSTAQATFAFGRDGWGFAIVHDGSFRTSTDVAVSADVRSNGYPERITYRFLDESWTWRIDPQGERAAIADGPLLGADGTCTRDGDRRRVRHSMGNSDWWTDGRADAIIAKP